MESSKNTTTFLQIYYFNKQKVNRIVWARCTISSHKTFSHIATVRWEKLVYQSNKNRKKS